MFDNVTSVHVYYMNLNILALTFVKFITVSKTHRLYLLYIISISCYLLCHTLKAAAALKTPVQFKLVPRWTFSGLPLGVRVYVPQGCAKIKREDCRTIGVYFDAIVSMVGNELEKLGCAGI